ncbi:MAG: hypothetical protein ACPGGK_14865 [Pikeienuella sp.]
MDSSVVAASLTRRMLEHARQLYQDLSDELADAIHRLKSDIHDQDAIQHNDTLRAHRKALQTVLEYELQFLKQAEEDETGHDLDLDAAREEINRRIHRLAAAGPG